MKRKCITIFTILIFILLFSIEAGAADWKLFWTVEDTNTKFFYDAESVKHRLDSVFVSTHSAVSDKLKTKLIEKYNYIEGINDLSFIITRWELDCYSKRHRVTKLWYCNSEWTILKYWDLSIESPFEKIDRGIPEKLFQIFCKNKEKKD